MAGQGASLYEEMGVTVTVKNHDIIDVEVTVKHQTEKAWLVESHNTGKSAWVAKSIGELDGKTMQLPEWIAEEKELI